MTRSEIVLKYIVEYYIKNAQPVGSQTLIEEYKLNFSSATIRNEMYALEKMGYIEKPHTSGGRVPSAKGYRYYCENLRNNRVDEELKNSLQVILDQKTQSIEQVLKASCEILSHMTSLVSVVIGPDEKDEKLANIQLVKIGDNSITAIFVTDRGYVENKTFIVNEDISPDELVSCVKLLNDRLKGTPVMDLTNKMEALRPILNDYIVSHDIVYRALMETFVRFTSDRLSLYGREELFNNPEFQNDSKKLERVFKLLHDQTSLKEMDDKIRSEGEKTFVNIGNIEGNKDLSSVTAKINIGDNQETSITLLGPTRMDYDKALSALEYLAEKLNKYFDELHHKEEEDKNEK